MVRREVSTMVVYKQYKRLPFSCGVILEVCVGWWEGGEGMKLNVMSTYNVIDTGTSFLHMLIHLSKQLMKKQAQKG